MTERACAGCLRRSALVGFLSARLSAVLGGYEPRLTGVLSLGEDDLIDAVAGPQAGAARRFVSTFDADRARASVAAVGQAATCRHHSGYPRGLLGLADPPAVVYAAWGSTPPERLWTEPVVAVVGTRKPSRYASEVARAIGRGLGAAGVTVVSGLALGIDGAVHRGVLEAGGAPLAVLAGGADVPYPRAHAELYERVRGAGAVVSELPPSTPPRRWSFPARNRVMAGLSKLTVVVEAAEESGSLITAEFALELGREVGAVPGQVTSRRAAGGNRLLREGAAVIRSAQDALDEVLGAAHPGATPAVLDRGKDSSRQVSNGRGGAPVPAKPTSAPVTPPAPRSGSAAEASLAPPLRQVLDLVEGGEGVEAIARETGMSSARVRAALGRLELVGLVARDGLSGYVRLPAPEVPTGPILDLQATGAPTGVPSEEAPIDSR